MSLCILTCVCSVLSVVLCVHVYELSIQFVFYMGYVVLGNLGRKVVKGKVDMF